MKNKLLTLMALLMLLPFATEQIHAAERQNGEDKKPGAQAPADPAAQKIVWKKCASLPDTSSGGGAAVLNDKIYYAAGSHAPRTVTADFYLYDISADKWTQLADMPEPRGNLALAAANGKIYAIGGGFTDSNFEYSPETDSWKTVESMPTARQHIDSAVVGNTIHIIGGITSFKAITRKNEAFDAESGSWSEKAPIPSLRNNPAVVTLDRLIYVIGGAGSEKNIWETIATVECYDAQKDEWIRKSDLPSVLFKPGAVVVDNKIVVLGGQNGNGKSLTSVWVYDARTDTWGHATPLPRMNCFAGYASVGNKIYVIGGTTSAPDWIYYADVYEGNLVDDSGTAVNFSGKK